MGAAGIIFPADSAFVSGTLTQNAAAGAPVREYAMQWAEPWFLCIVGIVAVMIVLGNLRNITGIFPSLMGCLVRGKEVFNLEDSAQLYSQRDSAALAFFIPLCMIVSRYKVWDPAFLSTAGGSLRFIVTSSAIIAYIYLRRILHAIIRPQARPKTLNMGQASWKSFMTILSGIFVVTMGASMFMQMDDILTKQIMTHETALIFILFSIRKMQILKSDCSFFSTILYLCAVEFFPAGLLVAAVVCF